MAFGKKLKQSDENPSENNYCGGYAMAAILNDRDDRKEKDLWQPKAVYDSLQKQQKEVGEPLQGMVQERKRNGTDIVLPSSLMRFAQDNKFDAELLYADSLGFSPEIIEAEKQRCTTGEVKQLDTAKTVLQCFSEESVRYGLVLVNGYNHWIAVKRKSDNKRFSVYDPATGESKKVDGIKELADHLTAIDTNAGDLIITLK